MARPLHFGFSSALYQGTSPDGRREEIYETDSDQLACLDEAVK